MSEDVAAFAAWRRAAAVPAAHSLPRPGRKRAFGRADAPKIGSEGLETRVFSPYLQQRAPRAPRPFGPDPRGEDMPATAQPAAPERRISDRTRRTAGRVPAAHPAGIGDTGDANGDEA